MRGLTVVVACAAALAIAGAATSASHGAAFAASAPTMRELLVRFEPGAAQSRALAAADATVVERLLAGDLVRVRVAAGTPLAAADALLEQRGEVVYAEPNREYRLFATPNDAHYGDLWGMAQIEAPPAWDTTTGSDTVSVAVIDSGIDYDHPDLVDNRWVNAAEALGAPGADDDGNGRVDDRYGWDFAGNDAAPTDAEGHGTHVAGTIGARGHNAIGVTGVSWRVKLIALRAGDDILLTSAIVSSMQYACAKGARIVNGSFGSGVYSQAIHDAITACPNTLFVFAAGNGGPDSVGDNNDAVPVYPCNDPAENVICVAASTPSDALAGFSNYGATTVDVAAPGVDVLSTVPTSFVDFDGYAIADGTSMAAPHVSGAAALVAAHRPTASAAELKRAILLSADAKPGLSGRVATGRLNIRRALTQETQPPTGLAASSPSHAAGAWTNITSAQFAWSGATDPSGVDGYSYALSPVQTFVPDESKDAEETVTSATLPLTDGTHWFHVRARDNWGNWSDTVRVGPILVDTFQPVRPGLSSSSHRVGGGSADRTIDVAWSGALDSASGIDGYSISWSQRTAVAPDVTKDVEETTARATSPRLAAGVWWFNLRVRDNAGNFSDAVSLGPFTIKTTPVACSVPRLRGLPLRTARRVLAKRGCTLGRVTRARSRRVGRGRVIAQRPAPGLRLRRSARVALVISRGRR